jgi:protein-L-isoaspartate O-methyltransferase
MPVKNVDQSYIRDWYDTEARRNDQSLMYRTPWAQERYKTVTNLLLQQNLKDKLCLDVGCGRGYYSLYMARHGAFVQGFDISPLNVTLAERDYELESPRDGHCSFECRSWDSDGWHETRLYDLVLITEVIEHSVDPVTLVRKCEQAGRTIIATVPITETLPVDPWKVQGHLHAFRRSSFEGLFTQVLHSFTDKVYGYVIAAGRGAAGKGGVGRGSPVFSARYDGTPLTYKIIAGN